MKTFDLPDIFKVIVGGAVFVGVELALIGVAYTEAYNALETGQKPAPLTLRTIIQIVAFRLGAVKSLPTPHGDNGAKASNGGLLIILFVCALLFNQADASKDAGLLELSKYVSGGLAPLLLLLAGHEFAHALASRVLVKRIADRAHTDKLALWEKERDEAWRAYVVELENTPAPRARVERPVGDVLQKDFLLHGTTHAINENGRLPVGNDID